MYAKQREKKHPSDYIVINFAVKKTKANINLMCNFL